MPHYVPRISIRSITHDPDTASFPACLFTWNDEPHIISAHVARATAEDILTCASYADILTALLRSHFPLGNAKTLVKGMAARDTAIRERHQWGHDDTFTLQPAAATKTRTGAVVVKRGGATCAMDPQEARAMAFGWIRAAETAMFDAALRHMVHQAGIPQDLAEALFQKLEITRIQQETAHQT